MVDENDTIHSPHPPRLGAHIGLVRWSRDSDGDWAAETVTGRFIASSDGLWRLLLYTGDEGEYDLTTWSPFQPYRSESS